MAELPDAFAIRGRLAIAGRLEPGAVVVRDGLIDAVVRDPRSGDLPERVLDAEIVAPGLIDLQVNGGFGVEVGEDPDAIRHLAARLPATGVTSFLPTVITSPPEHYARVFRAFGEAAGAPGARALGLHVEGPFLSPRRAGAHRAELIAGADQALFEALVARDEVRLLTLAPERPGALARIRMARARGIVVSLGHTDTTIDELLAGVDAGATMVTHLFNAMSPFEHRAPGATGGALVDDRLTVGLIADGIHCHPAAVQLAVRAKGAERIALVSDMMPAAGMPPGDYALGGQAVRVDDAAARLDDGTLAGSIVTLDEAVRNVVAWTDASPADAIRMATETPARLLDLPDRGRIVPGLRADLTLFDAELRVMATLIAGELVHRTPA
jgi:N-acetylglucosamine-6-phosphate deacetylase